MKYFGTDMELEFVLTENKEVVFEKHNHISNYIAGLVLQGKVEVMEGQQTRECLKDDIYLIPVGVVHSIHMCSEETRVLSMCIGEKFLREHPMEEGKVIVLGYMEKMIEKQILQQDQAEAFYEALETFYLMVHKGEEDFQESFNIPNDPMNLLKEEIITQPEQELKLDEISKEIFISKYYLLRQFKEKIELTPHYFQIQNRIRKAKQLLRQGVTMTTVANEMGFYDQSHFIHYFEKFTGITPQEYLKSLVSLVEKRNT